MIPIAKPDIGIEESNIIAEVLSTGQLSSGEYVVNFENEFAKYIGTKYAVCTNSGTAALHAALYSINIKEGDFVITTPFSFIATANAILYNSAIPLFADIDPISFNINPESILTLIKKYKKKIKALLIVHLFGNPCDMDIICDICKEYNIALVEDCAQAHGAEYNNKKVGSFGLASAFSFYPTKNMTTGEGGIITTDNEDVYKKAKKFINHGQFERYKHDEIGYNYRMTNIQAALGLTQLKKLDANNNKRIENANFYFENINKDLYKLPICTDNKKNVFHQFTLRCIKDRNTIIDNLIKNDIGYGIYYPIPIPRQPVYNSFGINQDVPITDKACNEVLSIPVHPLLSPKDLKIVAKVLNQQ